MPGRPKQATFTAWVDENGGEDFLLDQIASGVTVTRLGEIANEALGFGSRRMVYSYMKAGGDERMARYREALKESAHALVDMGRKAHEDIADTPVDPARVSAVKNRGDWYKWEAAKRDKETFGDGPSVGQAITDLGSLFLSALQSHGGHAAAQLTSEDEDMATPRMQKKLDALAAAKAEGRDLSAEQLEAAVPDPGAGAEIVVPEAEVEVVGEPEAEVEVAEAVAVEPEVEVAEAVAVEDAEVEETETLADLLD